MYVSSLAWCWGDCVVEGVDFGGCLGGVENIFLAWRDRCVVCVGRFIGLLSICKRQSNGLSCVRSRCQRREWLRQIVVLYILLTELVKNSTGCDAVFPWVWSGASLQLGGWWSEVCRCWGVVVDLRGFSRERCVVYPRSTSVKLKGDLFLWLANVIYPSVGVFSYYGFEYDVLFNCKSVIYLILQLRFAKNIKNFYCVH